MKNRVDWSVGCFARLGFLLFIFLGFNFESVWAQELDERDDAAEANVSAPSISGSSYSSSTGPSFGLGINGRTFQNVAYDLSGNIYSADFRFARPCAWLLGIEVPYIEGRNTGTESHEMGNVTFHSRFNISEIGEGFSIWIPLSVRIGQKGSQAKIASHHDTYRLGGALDYRRGRVESSMEAGYSLRTLEEDPQWDVGDIIDVGFSIRYALSGRLAATTQWNWYRVNPVKFRKQEIGSSVNWSTITPGIEYHLTGGLDLRSFISFPLLQSGTPFETDLALVEVYYPYTSSITFGWGLGAHF